MASKRDAVVVLCAPTATQCRKQGEVRMSKCLIINTVGHTCDGGKSRRDGKSHFRLNHYESALFNGFQEVLSKKASGGR